MKSHRVCSGANSVLLNCLGAHKLSSKVLFAGHKRLHPRVSSSCFSAALTLVMEVLWLCCQVSPYLDDPAIQHSWLLALTSHSLQPPHRIVPHRKPCPTRDRKTLPNLHVHWTPVDHYELCRPAHASAFIRPTEIQDHIVPHQNLG